MTKQWNEITPTPEQVEQTKRVERALANELNLLAKEGVPVAVILTALGMTIANLITCQAEAAAVAPWFEQQAALVRDLQGDKGKAN